MALKARTDKTEFDALSEDVQVHYSPDANDPGVFCLTVTPSDGVSLVNADGLKTALVKERSTVSSLQSSLKSYDGLNAEEARTAIKDLELLRKEGNGNPTRDEIRAELDTAFTNKFAADREALTKKFSSDIDSRDQKITTLSRQLNKNLVDTAAMSALSAADGSHELLLPIIRSSTKVITLDNGNLAIRVVDSKGLERMSPKAGSSDDMTIDEYVAELGADARYARAFKAAGKSGSGATGSSGNISGTGAVKLSGADARNPIKYRAAKERAIKQGKELILED